MPRSAPVPRPLPDTVIAAIVADVRRLRGLARRDLPKVPPAARPLLDDGLRAAGLEVTRTAVRLPAREQLLALFQDGGPIEEKGLATRLACVTPAEGKALLAALLAEGAIRRVERPGGPALALSAARTLDAGRAADLAADLERALKWIRRAARAPRGARAELLEEDVAALVSRLGASASAGRVPVPPPSPGPSALLQRLARTALDLAARHGGLAPVPLLVRSLAAPTASVHAALLEGHARGWFELQPESSMGRLGADDLALCLPGPGGTRLSWVRPLRAASSLPHGASA